MEIGDRLRKAREQRGLTLSDISHATKIPQRMLEAIERNDIAQLPHRFFARAYLRAYAVEVGVDPAGVLELFPAQSAVEPTALPDRDNDDELDPPDIEQERRPSHGWLVVVLGVAAAYGIYGVSPRRTVDTSINYAPSELAAPATETSRAPVPIADVTPPREVMQLQIQASGPCMVSATADGEQVVSRLVPAGDNATIEARGEIVLKVADAGGCVYSISSASGRRLHRAGETVIRFTEESAGALLARNMPRRSAAAPPEQIRPVAALQVAGTTGTLPTIREVAGTPIDASTISLLPIAPVPAAPAMYDAIAAGPADTVGVVKP